MFEGESEYVYLVYKEIWREEMEDVPLLFLSKHPLSPVKAPLADLDETCHRPNLIVAIHSLPVFHPDLIHASQYAPSLVSKLAFDVQFIHVKHSSLLLTVQRNCNLYWQKMWEAHTHADEMPWN